jgi:hypothetical protein
VISNEDETQIHWTLFGNRMWFNYRLYSSSKTITLALLLFYLNCVAVTPSVSFEGTCLLLPEFRISAKQRLYWNMENMIKVWK